MNVGFMGLGKLGSVPVESRGHSVRYDPSNKLKKL